MAFENLSVQRVVLHEVHKRRHDGALIKPRYATQLIALTADAMDMFRERVVDAMGRASQSMEMDIADDGPGSAVAIAASLLGKPDGTFVKDSAEFANKLAQAQIPKNLPGGMLVVFTGTVNAASHPFVAVIKAEKQTGFRGMSLQFLKDLFLTPASKLYKIGFFIREGAAHRTLPGGWKAFVYDSHMTTANRDGAAKYFFEAFLGCRIPENSAYLTRAFFEHTRDYIRALPVGRYFGLDHSAVHGRVLWLGDRDWFRVTSGTGRAEHNNGHSRNKSHHQLPKQCDYFRATIAGKQGRLGRARRLPPQGVLSFAANRRNLPVGVETRTEDRRR